MERLEQKFFTTEAGLKYHYHISPPGAGSHSVPPLLFLHGFPDDACLWKYVVDRLAEFPYRIIIPDLLGFGESSKPRDPAAYVWKKVQSDIVALLKAEKIDKVIIVGHDFGSITGQRLYFHNPAFVAGVAFIAVGLVPPLRQQFNLEYLNKLTKEKYGYEAYSYIQFINEEDAPELIAKYPEKFWEVLHGQPKGWTEKILCQPGAIRKYLLGNESVPLKTYAQDPQFRDSFLERAPKSDMIASYQWHRLLPTELALEPEDLVPVERVQFKIPTLFIASTDDVINKPEVMEAHRDAGTLPGLEITVLESGHWSPWEHPDEVTDVTRKWIEKHFGRP